LSLALVLFFYTGCHGPDRKSEPYGKTYYLDGGGNWGFGTSDVRVGLRSAGYKGDCHVFNWSHTLTPMLDQINILGARREARRLAKFIRKYKKKYPTQEVNVIALSAGTGITAWALEELDQECKVNNVFFLGSSLSATYDLSKALQNVKGKVYVYYSPRDQVLKAVQIFGLGTIDRKWGIKAAGQIGLRAKTLPPGQVANIGWSPKWTRHEWFGGHTDCVRSTFVQFEIGPKLMGLELEDGAKEQTTPDREAQSESTSAKSELPEESSEAEAVQREPLFKEIAPPADQ